MLAGLSCAGPTFDEVAPVVEGRCLTCHAADGASGLDLRAPETWTRLAPRLHEAVADRRMPPWPVGEDSPPVHDDGSLSDAARRDLLAWLDAGAPHPPGATLTAPERPVLDADVALALPAHEVAGDQRRCFLVDLPGGLLTGFDVTREGPVHHVLLGTWPEGDRALLEARDAADPGPGWACDEAFMPGADPRPTRVPVLWFPGPAPTRLSVGTGIPLEGVGVVQVHGLGAGNASGTLHLATARDGLVEHAIALGVGGVPLPGDGGEVEVEVQRRAFVGDVLPEGVEGPVWIVGGRGHGHGRLRHLTLTLDGTPILDLPRWDPHVQARYTLVTPMRAQADQVLGLTCRYADLPASEDDYGGVDEMCGGWVFVTADRPPDDVAGW